MDPITIGLMGLNFLDQQQQRKKQNALDQVEAKWSGFKGYNEYAPKAGTSSALTDATRAVGWYQALDKAEAAKKLAAQSQGQKAMQVDETEAAANFRGPPSSLKGSKDPSEFIGPSADLKGSYDPYELPPEYNQPQLGYENDPELEAAARKHHENYLNGGPASASYGSGENMYEKLLGASKKKGGSWW